MPDLEKVIMGLSSHGNSNCEYDEETMCPYWGENHCSSHLCLDALALLKADLQAQQEAQAALETEAYMEQWEPTYNPEDGSL